MRDPGAAELMDEAIKEGCDIVGGLPWYEYTDADAREHIDICFALAKKHDLDIHMLVDDTDDANSRSLEYLALKTMREGYQGGSRPAIAARWPATTTSMPPRSSTWWQPPASPSR